MNEGIYLATTVTRWAHRFSPDWDYCAYGLTIPYLSLASPQAKFACRILLELRGRETQDGPKFILNAMSVVCQVERHFAGMHRPTEGVRRSVTSLPGCPSSGQKALDRRTGAG